MTHLAQHFLAITPLISFIRAYVERDGYAQKLPFVAIVSVLHLSDDMVFLCGAHGDINRKTWAEVWRLLRARGVTTICMFRHKKLVMRDITV